jgi:hypothetical protein
MSELFRNAGRCDKPKAWIKLLLPGSPFPIARINAAVWSVAWSPYWPVDKASRTASRNAPSMNSINEVATAC